MAATVVLAVFAVGLLACSLAGVPTVMPLLAGFILFFVYGLVRGHGWAEMARASWNGVRTAAKILITFMLIGVLTATWRASGTIVYIVNATSGLCSGSVILLATFLLCSLVSFLTGTSFGTAATMGTICAFVATDAGVPLLVTGGAVLAGSYFGDRCSPVSTSALLVGTLTRTQVADNIPAMVRSSLVPFVLSCVLFFAMGAIACGDVATGIDGDATQPAASATSAQADAGQAGESAVTSISAVADGSESDVTQLGVASAGEPGSEATRVPAASSSAASSFASGFALTPWALLPAILVLGLSLLRVDVWPVLAAGFLSAAVIACVCQGMQPSDMLWACVAGFSPAQGQSSLLSGGGIVSMLNVTAIVLVSSTYAGIFEKTGMLDGVRSGVEKVAARCGSFAATLLASVACALVCCNQSLTIMLSKQLCENAEPDQRRLALFLEDTAVVVAGLVPWSIAAAVPLAAVGAPSAGVITACYLYLIPLWNLLVEAVRRREART